MKERERYAYTVVKDGAYPIDMYPGVSTPHDVYIEYTTLKVTRWHRLRTAPPLTPLFDRKMNLLPILVSAAVGSFAPLQDEVVTFETFKAHFSKNYSLMLDGESSFP